LLSKMRRRELLILIATTACPEIVAAQQEGPTRRVGVLTGNMETDPDAQMRVQAFKKGLADLGWIEGRNLHIEVRWPGPNVERQQMYARELVALAPDVILATSTPTTRALKDATQTIPVVFVGLSDPVATGIVSSIARPEANITGFMLYEHSLAGKWLTLLKDMSPALKHVAVLFNPQTTPYASFYVRSGQEVGERLGVSISGASVTSVAEIDLALSRIEGADSGLMVLPDGGFVAANSASLIALAAKYRVPAIFAVRFYAVNGGLMSYGADLTLQFRDGATYADQILRGAKPAELPVRFAAKFDLVINVKAADALGLKVPRHLMVGAEMVR
jgi:putative ABC transport system substrate-binding protein